MACGDDLVLAVPNQTVERQKTSSDGQHCPRRLFRRTRVYDGDTAIMASKGKCISTRREGYTLNPTSRVIQEFTTNCVKGEPFTPGAGLRAGVDTLDEAGKHPGMRVSRPRSQENGVWMPSKGGNSAADGLLQVLRDPPVILLFKIAHRDHASTRSNSELLFRR